MDQSSASLLPEAEQVEERSQSNNILEDPDALITDSMISLGADLDCCEVRRSKLLAHLPDPNVLI